MNNVQKATSTRGEVLTFVSRDSESSVNQLDEFYVTFNTHGKSGAPSGGGLILCFW